MWKIRMKPRNLKSLSCHYINLSFHLICFVSTLIVIFRTDCHTSFPRSGCSSVNVALIYLGKRDKKARKFKILGS